MRERPRILIADDDADIREVVRLLLLADNFAVEEACDGFEAVDKADDSFDLIILDVIMPGPNGYAACEQIRKKTLAPVLFLTAKTEDSDKTLGFSVGGDDYLVKPFSYNELLARAKALLRRYREYSSGESRMDTRIYIADLEIDTDACEVRRGDRVIPLTDIEYRVLLLLATHRKKVFSIENIYESVWNEPYFHVSSNTVMVHIKNLRGKLRGKEHEAEIIKTVWGKGYRIE